MEELTHTCDTSWLGGHQTPQRGTYWLEGEREVRALRSGMDFRDVRYRREVFIRFYLFHLMYRGHPGCVYYLMPYLTDGGDVETKLWFAFINGCTQHPVTTTLIIRCFPKVPMAMAELGRLDEWFNAEWARLPFDTDRRYQKKQFPMAVTAYVKALEAFDGCQEAFFGEYATSHHAPESNFDRLWSAVQKQFLGFGRLSTWSYLEYLFVMGLPLEPSSMMLRDTDGSKSHRNGLAKVLGRDDLDWHKSTGFDGRYSKEVLSWLETEAELLLEEVRQAALLWNERSNYPQIDMRHISRFTFESALCTFKGWFRKDRRYPNVYNDMLRDRIEHVQRLWPDEDLSVFWEARRHHLPDWARVEDNPGDPGLKPSKQNHFRLTGRIPLMSNVWGVFKEYDETWRIPE